MVSQRYERSAETPTWARSGSRFSSGEIGIAELIDRLRKAPQRLEESFHVMTRDADREHRSGGDDGERPSTSRACRRLGEQRRHTQRDRAAGRAQEGGGRGHCAVPAAIWARAVRATALAVAVRPELRAARSSAHRSIDSRPLRSTPKRNGFACEQARRARANQCC